MSADKHVIVWEFDYDCVTSRVVCRSAADANCRLYCIEGCESWSQPERRDDGIWHTPDDEQWHRMAVMKDDECNVALFLNEGGSILEDAAVTVGRFVLAVTPIVPLWDGDHYEWQPEDGAR